MSRVGPLTRPQPHSQLRLEVCLISVAIVYARSRIHGLQALAGEGFGFGRYELPSPLEFGHPVLLLWATKVVVEEDRIVLSELPIGLEEVVFGFVIIVTLTRDPRGFGCASACR